MTFLYHSLLSEHHKNATKKSAAVVKISRKKKEKRKKVEVTQLREKFPFGLRLKRVLQDVFRRKTFFLFGAMV